MAECDIEADEEEEEEEEGNLVFWKKGFRLDRLERASKAPEATVLPGLGPAVTNTRASHNK